MSGLYLVDSTTSSDRNMAMKLRYPISSPFEPSAAARPKQRSYQPMQIASISTGFEKGDFLVREEKGSNIYFDFFEEAFNFVCQKGYSLMSKEEEDEYMNIIKWAHKSVPGGCRYNTGRLLLVLKKNLIPIKIPSEEEDEPCGPVMEDGSLTFSKQCTLSSEKRKQGKLKDKLAQSTNTLPTDSDSSASKSHNVESTAYSSASTSYVDSWE